MPLPAPVMTAIFSGVAIPYLPLRLAFAAIFP